MNASNNRFLLVRPNVILTSIIEPKICAFDPYFEAANMMAWVTSGLRDPLKQLSIIRGYAADKGVDIVHKEILTCDLDDEFIFRGQRVYVWQPAWSALLNINVIISPPKPARPLFDYFKNGKNRKGVLIQGSPHFKGTAFDVGGGADGIGGDVANELAVVEKAFAGKIPGFKGYLAEHNNNAVHCDCEPWEFETPASVA